MTPHQINVLLHHYVSPERWPRDSSDYRDDLQMFKDMEVLEDSFSRDQPVVTEKGRAWIAALCAVQCPAKKSVWLDDAGRVIEL